MGGRTTFDNTLIYLDFLRIGGVSLFSSCMHVVWVSLSFWHDSIPPPRGNILLFYASPEYVTAYVNSQSDSNNLTTLLHDMYHGPT